MGIKDASACELSFPLPDLEETYEFADVVFEGKVIEKKPIFPEDGFFEIFFEVQRIWKGVDDDEVSIISWYTGCGAPPDFIEGENYLVFAEENRYGNGFSNYTRTNLAWISMIVGLFTLDDILDEKGSGFTPLKNSSGLPPLCEKKEKPYNPDEPLVRGAPSNLRFIDIFGNSLSSVNLNQKTSVIYDIANGDSKKCVMEVEIFIEFNVKENDRTEQILNEKLSKTLEPGEGTRLTWDFNPSREGVYNVRVIPTGFPSHDSAITVYSPSQHDFPPLKQIENGVLPENVACKNGMKLIFKSTDGSPSCVFNSTAKKLIERGWAKSE